MTPEELAVYSGEINKRHAKFSRDIDELDPAPEDEESTNFLADAFAEAIFLRAFTAYENDLERLFLHYVTGGLTLQGVGAKTYLSITDEQLARKLTRAGFKFLSWAKPKETRSTAEVYLENGWPISDMMNAKSHDLADCERVRNRIAHYSLEAVVQFAVAQRNMLKTERLFHLSPGQFLRIRSKRLKKLHIKHYLDVMQTTLEAILNPPP